MTTRDTKALEDLLIATEESQITAFAIIEPGFGAEVGMSSEEVVPANGVRLIEVKNLAGGAATVFFQRNSDAISERGTALGAGESKIIPLGTGQSLNAIATAANTKICGQVYG